MEHRLDPHLDKRDRDYEEAQGPALKPCPFCHSTNTIPPAEKFPAWTCDDCNRDFDAAPGTVLNHKYHLVHASLDAWNRRAEPGPTGKE